MRKCVFLFAVTLAVMLNTTNGWGQEVVFSEGFDDSANLPAGWTQSGTSGCYWYVSNRNVEGYPNTPYSGSYSAFSYLNGKSSSIQLITPAIDMSSYETVKLTFAYINMQKESKLPNSDKITIYYRTSSSDSWLQIGNILDNHEVWTLSDEYEIETSSSPTFQIAFMGYSMLGYGVGIDNVKIVDATQCYPIASDITAGVDNRHVTLTWEAPTGATRYKYILSESELEEPDFTSATTITTDSMTFDVGGQGDLTGETDYWFYVKTGCNEGAHDNDYKSVQFTTLETCPSPKNVTVTDVQKHQFTINWNNSEFADEYQEYELLVNTTGEQPDTADGAQVNGITGTYYTIENLARNTHYYVYMRGTCDDVPEWKLVADTTTLEFETICNGTETIGTGSENTDLIPFMCVDGTYKTQIIYPADSLTNCLDKSINGIKFYANSSIHDSWNGNRFIIRIGNTSNNQFTTNGFLTESLTEVFNGSVSTNMNNEVIINFADNYKFKYNGNGILIEIEANNTNTGYNLEFKADESTQASYYTKYDNNWGTFYSDYVDYRPKVTFTTCEEVKACPEVTNLKANYISYKNATIFWDASNGNFLTGYEFVWDDEAITDFSQVPQNQKLNILKNENETIEVTLNNLTPSTKYYVYVRALCPNDPDEQQSNWSTIEFTTAGFNCDAPAPQQDRSESVTLNDQYPESSIIVYWGSYNAQQIELCYTTEAGFEPTKETVANEIVTNESELGLGFHTITGLDVNTTYYVWARAVCDLEMGNDGKSEWTLMGSATTEADTKDIIYENVQYTISGVHQGKVTIITATYNEDDLTPVDYDITYAENEDEEPGVTDYFNYKYVINVPEKFIENEQNNTEYEVIAINANAFDILIKNDNNIRVNIPLNTNVEGMSVDENVIFSLADGNRIINNDNTYYASKAYKVNLCDGAEIVQRPFGDQTLIISCPDGEVETENNGVITTFGGARLDFEKGWTETQASTSNMLEASLDKEESVITATRLNKVRIAATAENVNIPELENCEELKFQTDNVNRSYPDCQLTGNMPLGDETKVKAEMKFNNKEYYYFSLPFDCDDFSVMAGTVEVERSSSIDEALLHEDDVNRYVLFKWNESAYTSDETTGYVELEADVTMLEKNKGYVIAIVESAGWYDTYWNVDGASLDVTATFTASDDYKQIASSESNVEIPVTRADAMNAYSGWNLVGNPFYNQVKSSQYSFNKYVRKVLFDRGDTSKVEDYASKIPVLNAEIRPFETVFIQKSDAAGPGTVTVTGTSPEQQVQGAPAMLPEYITITLNDSSRMMDRTTIINDELSSDDFLQEEDLLKSHQSSNEIYTQYGDFDFSFNEMNIIDADKTIPLAVKVAAEGDYTIAMSSELSNYPVGYVFLHDKTLETYMKVSDGEVETLHLTEGVTEGRLELIIKVEEVIVEPDNTEDVSEGGIAVYVHHGIATIEGIEVGAMVTIVDATGKTLYMSEATGNRMDYQFTVRGVYMITVRNNAGVNTVKVVY